jgi:hypothetical protein
LTDGELLRRIGEFQSFDYFSSGTWQILLTVYIGCTVLPLAVAGRRWGRALMGLLFMTLAFRSARGLPLVALLLLPIANAEYTQALSGRFWLKYAGRLRGLDAAMRGYVWVPLLLLAAWGLLRYVPVGFPPDQFPVAAFPHIPAAARLFAPDKYGGYLIYRGRKVFFDGRSDFYGVEFLKQYGRIVQVRPGWRELWEPWNFSHALLPTDAPLRAALESAGWRQLYADTTATLLERPR